MSGMSYVGTPFTYRDFVPLRVNEECLLEVSNYVPMSISIASSLLAYSVSYRDVRRLTEARATR